MPNLLRVTGLKFSQRTFLSQKADLIVAARVMANTLLLFTHLMAVMRLRITLRTPRMESEMLLQRED